MTNYTDLLQQALDALESVYSRKPLRDLDETIHALRARLAQPEAEQVAWLHDCAALCANDVELWISACPHCGKPRTPPAQPAPAPDAKCDGGTCGLGGYCADCPKQQPAPAVREPLNREQQIAIREAHCNTASDAYFGARPILNDRTKRNVYEAGFKEGWEHREFARAIEAHHGITGDGK